MFESINLIATIVISVVTGIGGFFINVYKTKKQSEQDQRTVKDKIIDSIAEENSRLRKVNNDLEKENTQVYKDYHDCLKEKNQIISNK